MLAAGSGALAAGLVTGHSSLQAGTPDEDRETVLVLDASNSMLARDMEPSRLARQQELAVELVSRLPGRVGVVYFAGHGYVLAPLTTDRGAAVMYVQAVDPEVVGRGGTSLALGLRQGLDVLAGGEPTAVRALVLFSDGEATADMEGLPEVVERATRERTPVYTVGLGTVTGARIPLPEGRAAVESSKAGSPTAAAADTAGFLRDGEGALVLSRLDEELLREIARATGAVFVPATRAGLESLLARVGGVTAADLRGSPVPVNVLLLAAFGLLFAEAYLFRRG
jgi:Ca-activated chloride channel family protein